LQAPRAIFHGLRIFGRDLAIGTDGATAVVAGLVFTGLVGFVGLGTETGMWYYTHRTMQAAADSSALSASAALEAGSTNGFSTEGKATAAQYGFADGTAGVTVTVNHPPASGNFAGNAKAVEVIVQQPQTALITASFLPGGGPTIAARAVALQGNPGTGCVLALDTGASAATFGNGTTNVNLVKCGLYVNSNSSSALTLVGGAQITADSASIVGNLSDSGNAAITTVHGITVGAQPATDPYQNVQIPPTSGCDHSGFSAPKNGPALMPGVYCNGLSINANANVQLSPGTYIIDRGSLSVSGNATVTGTGVTFVLTDSAGTTPATVAIHGGATLDIQAPTTGAMAGIAFIQDRNGTSGTNNDFSGGTSQSITGVIYFPKETISFAGGTQTGSGCLQLVADEVDFKGNANLEINCSGKGTATIGAGSSKLVE
jgi:Flp pilus assembly protein TadG